MRYFAVVFLLIPSLASGDYIMIGPAGINSKRLELTGKGVVIGQAEVNGRSAKAGYDPGGSSHSQVKPFQVYYDGQTDGMNGHISDHATSVAGVIIATGEGNSNL